jgi:hypothetical protein
MNVMLTTLQVRAQTNHAIGEALECVVQDLTVSETASITGGTDPAPDGLFNPINLLPPQEQNNLGATVIAGAIGASFGGNPLGAQMLGSGAGAAYLYSLIGPVLKLLYPGK